jgi:hypothetical protein
MADLALRLKVFIASPCDVAQERDLAEQELLKLQRSVARQRLLIESYRWETQAAPTMHRIQSVINTQRRTAELTIGIFWTTLGSSATMGETGSMEELRIAGERVSRGSSDDLFLYFKTATPPPGSVPEKLQGVRRFRQHAVDSGTFCFAEFADADDFTARLRRDLEIWIDRWQGAADVCAYALRRSPGGAAPAAISGENRLARLTQQFDPSSISDDLAPLASASMWLYQEHGPAAAAMRLELSHARRGRFGNTLSLNGGFQQLVNNRIVTRDGGGLRFASQEWFFYFCAVGVVTAIVADDVHSVERRPYINEVHQYVQALAVGDLRMALIPILRKWLRGDGRVTEGKPVARNFAAYVLGMIGATDACDDLARVLREDSGEDEQFYAVASLGLMRARVQLPVLVALFNETENERLRLMIAQAVSRMVGIADYPL